MSKPDPRIASATVVGGPPDLVGQDLVIVDEIVYRGEIVHIPRPLAGVPEFVAVAEEVKADELRDELLTTLVDEGPAKWQKNTTLVVEMRAAAESAGLRLSLVSRRSPTITSLGSFTRRVASSMSVGKW